MDLVLNGVELPVSDSLVILGVTLDSKLTFEKHISNVVSSAARSMGIVRRASRIFGSQDVLTTCFRSYVLSRLEYCAPSWWSSADTHLLLLEGIVSRAERLCGRELCGLEQRRLVSCLCMLFKIYNNPEHALRDALVPKEYARQTRAATSAHEHQFEPVRCKTSQFGRCFIPRAIEEWNDLPPGVFESMNLQKFKVVVNRHLVAAAS